MRTVVFITLSAFLFTAAAGHAAENPRDCCKVIRVDEEKGVAWLRNPRNGMLAQFRLASDDAGKFKVGDRFNPQKNLLNGSPLARKYAMVLPKLDPSNARVIRVRGAEVALEATQSKTVYRFYALKFGRVLSSIKPGEELLVDEVGRWAIVRVEGYAKVQPSVWAFQLD